MPKCSALGCKNNAMHRFPADEKLRNLWIEAINRANWQPNSASRLCSEHFKPEDFYGETENTGEIRQRRFLIKGTVPSFFQNSKTERLKVTLKPSKIKAMTLAETKKINISTNLQEALKVKLTKISDAPKLMTIKLSETSTNTETPIPSTMTPKTPNISTKTSETQKIATKTPETQTLSTKYLEMKKLSTKTPETLSTKSIGTSTVSTKTPDPTKILKNPPMILKIVPKKTQEAQKVFTNTIAGLEVLLQTEVPSNTYYDAACFCCLSTDVPVLNVMKCKHNHFLKTYYKINTEILYICVNCHHMLKKIEAFRTQVNENCYLLRKCDFVKSQKPEGFIKKQYNLQTIPVSVLTCDVAVDTDLTAEGEHVEIIHVTEIEEDTNQSDIKMESEIESENETYSETQSHTDNTQNYIETNKTFKTRASRISKRKNETETHEQHTKKHKKNTVSKTLKAEDEKYTGKIRTVILTEEELNQDRERLRNDEAYLKLNYKCESCIKGFNYKTSLKMHNGKHHPEFSDSHVICSFTCNICKCVHTNKRHFNAHMRAHYRRFECLACKKRSGDLETLAYHYNTVHSNTDRQLYPPIPLQYDCSECTYTTDSHRKYRYHKQKHKTRIVCDKCKKEFMGQFAYRRHVMNYHSTRTETFQCELCSRIFTLKSNLTTHKLRVHSKQKMQWHCFDCNHTYSCKASYNTHLKTSLNHVDLKFICDDCGTIFRGKMPLRRHIEWEHLKNYRHKCELCNQLYQSANGLRNHVQSRHLNIRKPKNVICDYCGQRFLRIRSLNNHLKRHTGERPPRGHFRSRSPTQTQATSDSID